MAPLKSPKRQRIHVRNATKMRRKRASARNATKRPKRGASSTGDEPLPSLPEELIFEILFRVPVKSLIRFKCVSKSWEALISDPKFATNHLRTSSADPNATHQQLLSSVVGDREVVSFSLHALFRNPRSVPDAHSINTSDKYHILGSCNGLLCVCDIHYRYVMLWNPATKLTSRRFPTSLKPGVCLTFHGFGYDDLNDKYKLLVVEGDLNLTVTKVLTFVENSWKVIPNFRRYCPTEWQGKFVNGTLHWLSKVKVGPGDKDRRLVFSFDLRTETYNAMVSVFDGIDQISNLGLNVLRNCLSFCFFDCKGGCWVVWSIKEYGVNGSCTKFMKIPHMIQDPCSRMQLGRRNKHGLFASGLHHPLNLVSISDDGVLVFKTEFCQMVLYEPKNRRCIFINHTCGDVKVYHLQVYQESLVSPLC